MIHNNNKKRDVCECTSGRGLMAIYGVDCVPNRGHVTLNVTRSEEVAYL
jgi:hypothetical protein